MAGYQLAGSLCQTRSGLVDSGTLCATNSPTPGVLGTAENDHASFESVIAALEGDVAYLGTQFVVDAQVRLAYAHQIKAMADDFRMKVANGSMSWKQAATEAQEVRNAIMEVMRTRSTPVGRANAELLKSQGRTLNELIARKTKSLFGDGADFNRLPEAGKNHVYSEIVKSAGKSDPVTNAKMLRLSRFGRGLLFLSIAASVYAVANSDDKVATAKHEAKVSGAGIAGGMAGGALAGLMCGPGAPVCVTVGAFIGGALAAFSADYFW